MKPEILIVGPLYPATQARVEELFTAHRLWEAADRAALLHQVAERVRGIAVYALHPCPAEIIEALPRLEIIACFGIGVDLIDLACARARGIRVTNTPDVVTGDTADLALGLMLAALRRIPESDRFTRRGDWQRGLFPFGRSLGGRRLGIVGLGRIGQAIARRAASFDMAVAYHGPRPKPDAPYPYFADLAALAEWSEVLAVACPGGEATRHLVGAEIIAALGAEGVLINIARGSVVDEAALVAALAAGRIAGAGLDVFEREPAVPAALLAMENVVLTPHIGTATHETRRAMGELMIENLLAHFAGRPLPTPVL